MIFRGFFVCIFGICLLSVGGCTHPSSVSDTPVVSQGSGTIYILGDSLTAGYQLPADQAYPAVLGRLLAQAGYARRVINGGESGDTSAGLIERIDRVMADAGTGDIALIVIGGNDGLQGLSTQALGQNIQKIILGLQSRGIQTMIGGMQIPTNLGDDYRQSFAAVYPRVARETSSPLIPFILSGVAGIPLLNLPDGIHPNTTGQAIVAQTVFDFLVDEGGL